MWIKSFPAVAIEPLPARPGVQLELMSSAMGYNVNCNAARGPQMSSEMTCFASAEVDLGPACTPSSWDGEENNNQSLSNVGAKSPATSENGVDKDKQKGDDVGSDSH